MAFILRDYQKDAVDAAVRFLKSKARWNALEVLPTGSGKSLVIANIAKVLGEPVLIFQPTKEILEQNYAKLLSYGFGAGIYSASKNRREIYDVTFATIGSVIRKTDLFRKFKHVIVDECHFCNPKAGMYKQFIEALDGVKVLGLTATPYRLVTDGFGGSILKFITRTRPRIFTDLIYYVQNGELFDRGHLASLRYVSPNGFDRSQIRLNSTGADFDDRAVRKYYKSNNFPDSIVKTAQEAMNRGRKNLLVFTRFIEEAQYCVSKIPGSAIVTSETPKKERENILSGFKFGLIPTVCNVGVLTTGFDYPELETIIIARPTMSLALYYQMIGRGIRPHPEKPHTEIIDLCGNMKTFGRVEDLRLVDGGNGQWYVASRGRQLTNIYYGERRI
jgi:DNA repair protein RadD